jgi:hypothetical protein
MKHHQSTYIYSKKSNNEQKILDINLDIIENKKVENDQEDINFSILSENKFDNSLNEISSHLNTLVNFGQNDLIENNLEKKWRYAASVLDKLFFIFSLIYGIIILVTLNLAIPNFYGLS